MTPWPKIIIKMWKYCVNLKDRLPSKELRERLGVDDIALVLQQNRLRWYGHMLRKDDTIRDAILTCARKPT